MLWGYIYISWVYLYWIGIHCLLVMIISSQHCYFTCCIYSHHFSVLLGPLHVFLCMYPSFGRVPSMVLFFHGFICHTSLPRVFIYLQVLDIYFACLPWMLPKNTCFICYPIWWTLFYLPGFRFIVYGWVTYYLSMVLMLIGLSLIGATGYFTGYLGFYRVGRFLRVLLPIPHTLYTCMALAMLSIGDVECFVTLCKSNTTYIRERARTRVRAHTRRIILRIYGRGITTDRRLVIVAVKRQRVNIS